MKRFLSDEKYILNAFLRAADDLGIDHKKALNDLGLSRVLLSSPENFVPSHIFNLVLEEIAASYHCHDLALRVAQHLTSPHLGLAARITAFSLDLRSGLKHADNYSLYYQDTGCWQHNIVDKQVHLYKPASTFSSQYNPQRNLLGTAQMVLLLKKLTNNLWHPSSICLSFSDPSYRFTETFETFFQCEVRFQQGRDEICFVEDILDYSLETADPNMQQSLENQVKALQKSLFEDRDFVECVKMIIDQRLRFSTCTAAELAQFMGMSIAELVDKLDAAGTNFEDLLQQQRLKRAQYYISRFNCPVDLVARAVMPENPATLTALLEA